MQMENQILLIFSLLLLLFASLKAYPSNLNSNGLIEYDILVVNNSGSMDSVNGFPTNAIKWSNGVVPYQFSRVFDDKMKSIVKREMAKIERITCVKFSPKTHETDYVRFIQDGSSCYSQLGMTGGMQEISLPNWCLDQKDGVMHELLHALGLVHEHTRHDRDDYITIHWENIQIIPDDINWKKHSRAQMIYFGTEYDYTSVMHYHTNSRGAGTIITPKRPGTIGSNGLSKKDVHKINKHYQCTPTDNPDLDNPEPDNPDPGNPDPANPDPNNPDPIDEPDPPTCVSGHYYCGSELRSNGFDSAKSSHLYQCKNNVALFHYNCGNGLCLKSGSGDSYCACNIGHRYCGYELFLGNWGNEYDNRNEGQVLYESLALAHYINCIMLRNATQKNSIRSITLVALIWS